MFRWPSSPRHWLLLITGDTGLDRPVIDRTGFQGNVDFILELDYTEMEPTFTPNTGPAFLEELNDQLGLKLQKEKGPEDFYIVDHVERLSADDAQYAAPPPQPKLASPRLLPVSFNPARSSQGAAAPSADAASAVDLPKSAETYSVASIKVSKGGMSQMRITNGLVRATNISLKTVIRIAYGVQAKQLEGGPSWLDTTNFEIEAKTDDAVGVIDSKDMTDAQRKAYQAQLMVPLQHLLADRSS